MVLGSSQAAPNRSSESSLGRPQQAGWPDNPVLTRVFRGQWVESQHRGAWVRVDRSGKVLESRGAFASPVFARSALKPLQALALVESGAAAASGLLDDELAVVVASHNGEPQHVERVQRLLARVHLSESALQCGAQPPGDRRSRTEMLRQAKEPSAVHNNCSGKHAGFLALAIHLGCEQARYLDPESKAQLLVRQAVGEMCDCRGDQLTQAIDGCSAPSFRLPLVSLAAGFARLADPRGLGEAREAACLRIVSAVRQWPELIAGRHQRICTDLVKATKGRLMPKFGAEAVYAIGVTTGTHRGEALAVKVDDGDTRGLHALIVALCERFGWLEAGELDALSAWREGPLRNWADIVVGRIEVLP